MGKKDKAKEPEAAQAPEVVKMENRQYQYQWVWRGEGDNRVRVKLRGCIVVDRTPEGHLKGSKLLWEDAPLEEQDQAYQDAQGKAKVVK